MFTWIPIYKEISEKLLQYKNNQQQLLEILLNLKEKGVPVISINDRDQNNNEIPLSEIDPFTFMASFNRGIKDKNRIDILRHLKEIWQLQKNLPDDFAGIPVVNNQRSWFFGYNKDRKKEDIPLLI